MDAVYSQLLKSGRGGVKRHYELTGALADAELSQNPESARTTAPLLRAALASTPGAPPTAIETSKPHAQNPALPPPTTSPASEQEQSLERVKQAASANAPP